jgi:hypothetical protein
MKPVLRVLGIGTIALALFVLLYRFSPWSRRTASIRVELAAQPPNGQQAILVNGGVLPVVIGRCDRLSDANQPETTVGDAIQRWDKERDLWLTVYQRSDCVSGIGGTAKFSHKLLWPGERLHTAPFFHSEQDKNIHVGDRVRFLAFTQSTELDSPSMPSQPFFVSE